MKPAKRSKPTLELLEARLVPAFNAMFSPSSSTWTLTQVADNGAVTVTVDASHQLVITEATPPQTTGPLGDAGANLSITMLSSTGNLEVDLNSSLTGNVTVNLANGNRAMTLGGTNNGIGGNLSITAGSANQSVELANVATLSVGGTASINLDIGSDSVTATTGANIGTDLRLRGVNFFDHAGNLTVGRNFAQDVSFESHSSGFDAMAVAGTTTIGGSFTYLGGSQDDELFLTDGVTIGSSFYANLGTNFSPIALVDEVRLDGLGGANGAIIGGSVTVLGGLNTASKATTRFITDTTTVIGGNISINFAQVGAGGGIASEVVFLGTFGGQVISFTGSTTGNDSVTFGMTGNRAHFSAQLGGGNDTFTLDSKASGTSLSYLYVDFGPGTDTYVNNYGAPYSFPVFLLNLP